jgi:hypothetical protein
MFSANSLTIPMGIFVGRHGNFAPYSGNFAALANNSIEVGRMIAGAAISTPVNSISPHRPRSGEPTSGSRVLPRLRNIGGFDLRACILLATPLCHGRPLFRVYGPFGELAVRVCEALTVGEVASHLKTFALRIMRIQSDDANYASSSVVLIRRSSRRRKPKSADSEESNQFNHRSQTFRTSAAGLLRLRARVRDAGPG